MGWLDGALRVMPGWEVRAFGFEIPNPFFPGVLLAGVTFTLLYLWPFLEARFTGDRDLHHLCDRPRDRPLRTAFGVATLTFYGILTFAAASDVLSTTFGVSVNFVLWAFRMLLFVAPARAGVRRLPPVQGAPAARRIPRSAWPRSRRPRRATGSPRARGTSCPRSGRWRGRTRRRRSRTATGWRGGTHSSDDSSGFGRRRAARHSQPPVNNEKPAAVTEQRRARVLVAREPVHEGHERDEGPDPEERLRSAVGSRVPFASHTGRFERIGGMRSSAAAVMPTRGCARPTGCRPRGSPWRSVRHTFHRNGRIAAPRRYAPIGRQPVQTGEAVARAGSRPPGGACPASRARAARGT